MTIIHDLRAAQEAYEASKQRLEALQNDPKAKALLEFESELRALMGRFGMSLRDVNSLLDPTFDQAPKAKGKATKKTRRMRRYTNPHTGEVLDYIGGLNAVLEEWKKKHGADVVKTWGVLVDPA